MRKPLFGVAIALCLALCACSRPSQKLVVYTAAEADQLPAYAASFRQAHPEIDLVWVRDSTGVVTAKLLAESKAEQADVVFALAATSMMQLDAAGLLEPYAAKGVERLDARFRDGRATPHWTGETLWTAAVCVNTDEARKHNLPMPESWEDLAKPIYRGMIEMPNPASSGTGLLYCCGVAADDGRCRAGPIWTGSTRTSPPTSIPAPSRARTRRAARSRSASRSISAPPRPRRRACPSPSSPRRRAWAGTSRPAGSSKARAGRKPPRPSSIGRCRRRRCASMPENFALVGDPTVPTPPPSLPKDLKDRLAPVSLKWTADNRQRIIDEWSARYAVKSEPTS